MIEEIMFISNNNDIKKNENYIKLKNMGIYILDFLIEKNSNSNNIAHIMLLDDILNLEIPDDIKGDIPKISLFYKKWYDENFML